MTFHMETILRKCLRAVLRFEAPGIDDLVRLLDEDRNEGLIARILGAPVHADIAPFFAGTFRSDATRQTRHALRMRFEGLLDSSVFSGFLRGKSTFSLPSLIHARKVVVVNLAVGRIGEEASAIIGRLLLAHLQIHALSRQNIPSEFRVRTHVFIDECHRFVSPSVASILREARKYRMALTLAEQIPGNGMPASLFRVVLGNTAVKFVGVNSGGSLRTMASEADIPIERLFRLRPLRFALKTPSGVSTVRVGRRLLGDRGGAGPEAWERVREKQAAAFYVPVSGVVARARRAPIRRTDA